MFVADKRCQPQSTKANYIYLGRFQPSCIPLVSTVQLGGQITHLSHLTNLLTARVVGATKTISQPVSSIFSPLLHCPLGLGELQACPFPNVAFPLLPPSALSSSPLSLCLARWFWPDLMNGKHDHTTAVCLSLR